MEQATEFFDRRFVYAACTIGAGYSLIIAGLGSLLDKEAAGVAGVALTALATGIFKQFEIRFRRIAEREERAVSIPRLNMPYLLLLVFAFVGIQFVVGMLFGAILASFGWLKIAPSMTFESFGDLFTDYKFLVSLVGLIAISHFAAGYLCGRTAPSVSFSYALIGSVLSAFVQSILPVIGAIAQDWHVISTFADPAFYTFGIFWLVYAVCAFLGAHVGFRGRMLFPEPHDKSI
jgi:NADH:ubiquinone oxidoreductase subunit 6 (subunit J)